MNEHDRKAKVLILCTGNSCRSQMAEGFLRRWQGDLYEVHSAGTEPKGQVHPLAVRAMAEAGVDISGQRPKDLAGFLGHLPVAHLVIVCDRANQTCPRIWPGTFSRSYLPFDDPARFVGGEEETMAEFRRLRDEIGAAMRAWVPQSGGE
jgi:arsenate reductase